MYTENKNGYYIDNKGNKVILEFIYYIFIPNKDINILILPESCRFVVCHGNNIKELIIPKGCIKIYCDYNTVLINKNNCREINYYF